MLDELDFIGVFRFLLLEFLLPNYGFAEQELLRKKGLHVILCSPFDVKVKDDLRYVVAFVYLFIGVRCFLFGCFFLSLLYIVFQHVHPIYHRIDIVYPSLLFEYGFQFFRFSGYLAARFSYSVKSSFKLYKDHSSLSKSGVC